jgi:iron(III)-enterobactin esterase
VTVVEGKGGFGKNVLQVHLPAGAARGYAVIGTTRLPESLKDHAFGRAYVYITPNGPTRHTVLAFAGTASWPNSNFLEVAMFHGGVQLSYQQQATLPHGEAYNFGKALPLGKWFCLEWEVQDSPDTLTVWIDGEQANSEVFTYKTFGNTNLVKGFADFGVGVRVWGPVPADYDIYYDNIAFDAKRIGPLPTPPAPMPDVTAPSLPALAAKPAPRPTAPTRSPTAPGTPKLTVVGAKPGQTELRGAPGMNPPVDADGDFLIGPDYVRAPELTPVAGVPKGTVQRITMNSMESKFYPGITRVPPGESADYRPADPLTAPVYPKPFTRTVTVYIPAQYVPGTEMPVIVTADGPDGALPVVLDNLIAQHRVPPMVAVMIQNGGGDGQGSERGLEYDTVSGKYGDFVEAEVLPLVQEIFHLKITKDPEGRATMGGSSGGAVAFTMAWYHPELYHRVITFSGTYVYQQSPANPETPHGAWGYHETLIPQSPAKPLRIWLQVGDRDNLGRADGFHDWVEANNHMAAVLKAKGYHYQYLFCLNAGHTDRNVKAQTLPEALEWVWQGYPRNDAK